MNLISRMISGYVEGVKVLTNFMLVVDKKIKDFPEIEAALKAAGWFQDPGGESDLFIWIPQTKWVNPCANVPFI